VNLYRPPRRGSAVAIALLSIGFLLATVLAVIEFVELQRARDRVEELEAQAAGQDGGLFGDLGDLFGDLGGAGALSDQAGLIQCLGGSVPGLGSGEPPAGPPEQQVAAIADRVEELRDLQFREPVEPTFLSSDQASARVQELFLQDYTEDIADTEERILTELGAIEPGTDLRKVRAEALGQQVAGFYDPRSSELVIRQAGDELAPLDRITLAHELDHALTDQVLGLPLPDEPVQGREDRDLASLALVEGDATLVMQRYSTSLSLQEQLELLDPAVIAQSEAGLGDVPPYLEQELLFPYETGLQFVCDLFAEGGWDAVDAAYRDPPESTAQVLFPDRYLADEQPVEPPEIGIHALLAPWRRAAVVEFGAAQLEWLFSAPGGDPGRALGDPRAEAGEWAGGQLRLWTNGPRSALSISLVDRAGGGALCGSAVEWYGGSFTDDQETGPPGRELIFDGPRQDAVIACTDSQVRMGIGPNGGIAMALIH
jgi:hypothetical protein